MLETGESPTEYQASNQFAAKPYLPYMLLLFFGSGCAALIYEVVWLQLLELVIGSSGISLGVLLGTYMGGMCLGSWLLPRCISLKFHPLRVYAALEFGIGLIGVLVLFCLPVAADLYSSYSSHGVFARALVAAVFLVPPTVLMGATLPAVARFVKLDPAGVSWMGFFYGGNIAGAVIGCLGSGFFLLRLFNMPTATGVAALINLLVASIALILAKKGSYMPSSADSLRDAQKASHRSLIYFAIALSGLSALGGEVVWTRLLSLLLGGTVYSFSIILAVFLIGLGLGSGGGSVAARVCSRPRLALGICQLALAGTIAWAALVIAKSLPYWPVNPSIYTGALGPWYLFQLDLLRTAWMIFPASLLWGASFPLAIAAVASKDQDPGRMVGGIYAANTVGAILGSLGFSLWIIPQFGTQWAERILIAIAVLAALFALTAFAARDYADDVSSQLFPRLKFSGSILTVIAVLLIALSAAAVSRIPWVMVAWGRFTPTYIGQADPEIFDRDRPLPKGASASDWFCSYVGEGMNVSVAVTKTTNGTRYFHGAGKVQASSLPQDMRLQRMLGHLSALACQDPRKVSDVLVVACGAGVTAGSFITYPNVRQITVCDIEPLVPQIVTPMFGPENYHLMDGIDKENPHFVDGKKVKAVYDDGRHYIRTLPRSAKFDVITSDPIDPWVKGSAALNTVEFYEMCKSHLKPGGVMSLWMPLYESNMESAKSMIATFFKVFPQGMLFSNDDHLEGYDAVLLGQAEPSPLDVDQLADMLGSPEYSLVKQSLANVGFGASTAGMGGNEDLNIVVDLLATYTACGTDLSPWTRNAQLNRDRDLRLQYLAGMYFNSYLSTTILRNILAYYRFPENTFMGSPTNIDALRQTLLMAGRRDH
jgi:spermidine synthase